MSGTIRPPSRLALVVAALLGGGASALAQPCLSGSHLTLPGSGKPALASYARVEGGDELQNPTGITIDLRFYSYTPHTARLLSKGAAVAGSLQRSYDITLLEDGRIQVDLFFISPLHQSQVSMQTGAVLAPGAWHRVVVTFDSASGAARLSVPGQGGTTYFVDQTGVKLKGQQLRPTPGPLHIGGTPALPTDTLLGAVDEVRIWTRALTDAEIQATAALPLDGLDGLAASFHFDGTLLDLSGGHVATTHGITSFQGKCASFGHYGAASGGANGAPVLTLGLPPVGGTTSIVQLGNPTGAFAPALLVAGPAPLDVPAFGGSLLAQPLLTVVLGTGPNGTAFPFQVPPGNYAVFAQAFVPDATAPQGVGVSRGLFVHTGQ